MGLRRWNRTNGVWESFGTPQVNPASIGAAPSLHAVQHAIGGTDYISPTLIGAVSATAGSVTSAPTNSAVVRNISQHSTHSLQHATWHVARATAERGGALDFAPMAERHYYGA